MKKLLIGGSLLLLLSCNDDNNKGKFTVNGELKGAQDQRIYLEELFFSQKDPEVLDTGAVKNGKFSITAIGGEEGLYRLRLEKQDIAYFFTNDNTTVNLVADVNNPEMNAWNFSGAANSSLKRILTYTDSIKKSISATYGSTLKLKEANINETDSVMIALTDSFNKQKEVMTEYCYRYADTAANPIVALFSATMAPVEISKFVLPIEKLSKRFPKHNGISNAVTYIKAETAKQEQKQLQQTQQSSAPAIGTMAPDITMNDVNDKSFSLSQLRGKYVLVDFWASWCGPCRAENPTVVAAYNKFKDKNFTILGVSLDNNKSNWLAAIATDGLAWTHISDLKKWESPVVALYGLGGIPYNVLVDPQGKVIATELRGPALEAKLAELIR